MSNRQQKSSDFPPSEEAVEADEGYVATPERQKQSSSYSSGAQVADGGIQCPARDRCPYQNRDVSGNCPARNRCPYANFNRQESVEASSTKKKKGKKIGWKYVIGGAAVCAIAAPLAVPVALGAIGFTSGGIAAGSMAASMMASYGGAVTSGSVVAVCQSIGAAGLGATGTMVAGVTGAAFGAGAGAGISHAVEKDEEQDKDD